MTDDTDDIDEVAVERACKGDRSVHLDRSEVAAAVEMCHRRGLSDGEAADLLGITSRTVLRVRSGATTNPFSRPGATVDTTKEKIAAALKHENATIRRTALRANDELAKLDRLLADWGADEMARERVAELERALAEAKAKLRRGKPATAKKASQSIHGKARAWAKENGIPVQDIGLVPRSVIEQYERSQVGAA